MSPMMPDSLSRLRAANPARTEDELGGGAVAQAAIERILADPGTTASSASVRRGRLPRGPILVLAAMLLGAGAAVATTDPFGWWSSNPETARYRLDPARRVRTPNAQEISCRRQSGGGFRCAAGGSGQRYMQIDALKLPEPGSVFSRAHFNAAITQRLAAGKMTAALATRFRADVAAVPASFFTELRLISRFGTFGGGLGRVPPIGIPEFLVCENAAAALSCQDLNGDQHAPVGAGVYLAQRAANWRPAPPHRRDFAFPPGFSFTEAEYRLLIDVATPASAGPTSSASSAGAVHAAPPPGPSRSRG